MVNIKHYRRKVKKRADFSALCFYFGSGSVMIRRPMLLSQYFNNFFWNHPFGFHFRDLAAQVSKSAFHLVEKHKKRVWRTTKPFENTSVAITGFRIGYNHTQIHRKQNSSPYLFRNTGKPERRFFGTAQFDPRVNDQKIFENFLALIP